MHKYNTKLMYFFLLMLLISTSIIPKAVNAGYYIDVARNRDNSRKNYDTTGYYIKLGLGNNRAKSARNYYSKNLGRSDSLNIGFGGDFISNNRLEINLIKHKGFKYSGEENNNQLIKERVFANIKSETIMLNIYSDQYLTEIIIPYFGFGIGCTKNKLISNTQTFINSKIVNDKSNATTRKSFAWQVAVGTNIAVHKRISFDLSYRYSYLGKLPAPTTHVNRNKTFSKLKNHEILFSVLVKI